MEDGRATHDSYIPHRECLVARYLAGFIARSTKAQTYLPPTSGISPLFETSPLQGREDDIAKMLTTLMRQQAAATSGSSEPR